MNAVEPTNAEKKAVWESYRAGNPPRVPLMWGVNPRIILLTTISTEEEGAASRTWRALLLRIFARCRISFAGRQSRPDIAERAVRAEAGEIALFPADWAD